MNRHLSETNQQIAAMRQNAELNTRHRSYWTEEDKQELKDRFYAGEGISTMALTFQRSELAIINQLNAMNLFQKHRAPKTKKPECLCSQCSLYTHCEKCTLSPDNINRDKTS